MTVRIPPIEAFENKRDAEVLLNLKLPAQLKGCSCDRRSVRSVHRGRAGENVHVENGSTASFVCDHWLGVEQAQTRHES